MEISFDGVFIFRGEIQRAAGTVGNPEACCECILFTTNDAILALVEKYDPLNSSMHSGSVGNRMSFKVDEGSHSLQKKNSGDMLGAAGGGSGGGGVNIVGLRNALSPIRGGGRESSGGACE